MKEIKNKGSDNQNPRLKTINHYAEILTRPRILLHAVVAHVLVLVVTLITDHIAAVILLWICAVWVLTIKRVQTPIATRTRLTVLTAWAVVAVSITIIGLILRHS